MAQYRNPYSNFYSDKSGSYMSIGSIVPVLVDSYSTSLAGANTGEGSGGDDPNFSYRNFMYCDGAQYDIKDYPLLYEKVGNDYVTLTVKRFKIILLDQMYLEILVQYTEHLLMVPMYS